MSFSIILYPFNNYHELLKYHTYLIWTFLTKTSRPWVEPVEIFVYMGPELFHISGHKYFSALVDPWLTLHLTNEYISRHSGTRVYSSGFITALIKLFLIGYFSVFK